MSTPTNKPPYSAELAKASREYQAEAEEEAKGKQAEPENERRFHFLSVADVLAFKPEAWRIKGLLPAEGVAVIYGAPGSGKTFLSLDLGFSISAGRDWFGTKTRPCPVVYINLEGKYGLKKRLIAWQEENGEITGDIQFITDPFLLIGDVAELARDVKPGSVVFIDTLNMATPGMDENDGVDMGKIVGAAKKLQLLIGGLVVLVHHSGKDPTKGERGHSALRGALDASIEVGGTADGHYWHARKIREGKDGRREGFRLKSVLVGYDEDNEPETSCVVVPDDKVRPIEKPLSNTLFFAVDVLKSALEAEKVHAVHVDKWRDRFYAGYWGDGPIAKKKAFQRARASLVSLKLVIANNDFYSLPGDESEQGDIGDIGGHLGDMSPNPYPKGGGQRGHTPIRRVPCPPADGPGGGRG